MSALTFTLHEGDMRLILPGLPADSFDSCVTDPPYELGFMGRTWDKSGVAFQPDTWREVFRVLKPGAHLVAFGGSRTVHRIACAIEDAGFEIRDTLQWLYGSGFPKSLDVAKAIDKAAGVEREIIGTKPDRWTNKGNVLNFATDRAQGEIPITGSPATPDAELWQGWGTALKPAHEPIILARKPLNGTVAANVLEHGAGALNIDACRVAAIGRPLRETDPKESANGPVYAGRQKSGSGFDGGSKAVGTTDVGRFPANILHDGSPEVLAAFAEFGEGKGAFAPVTGTEPSAPMSGPVYGTTNRQDHSAAFRDDTGSAARFFTACPYTEADHEELLRFYYTGKATGADRDRKSAGNNHPTVKPVSLMRWLVRLVTPPGGNVLDPFAGSGTTAKAAHEEGFSVTLCEQDPAHCAIIRRRPMQGGFSF